VALVSAAHLELDYTGGMWLPWERARLTVFADELQARGDPLGERIASSLAAETCTDPKVRAGLDARIAELDALASPIHRSGRRRARAGEGGEVDELVRAIEIYTVRREHGVVVALERARLRHRGNRRELDKYTRDKEKPLLELLGHRELQFVHTLEFPIEWFRGTRTLPLLGPWLLERFPQLRPRVIRVGYEYATPHRVQDRLRARHLWAQDMPPECRELVEPRRGLLVATEPYGGISLARVSAAAHNKDRAMQLEATLRKGVLDPLGFTRLARALWDTSSAVREVAYPAIAQLGVEAAAVIPDLLLLTPTRDPVWTDQIARALDLLGRRPAIVEATAPALNLAISTHRDWLATSAKPEVAALARPDPGGWQPSLYGV
jgi:hypothetical protein